MSSEENIGKNFNQTDLFPDNSFGDIDLQRFLIVFQKSILWIVMVLILTGAGVYFYLRYSIPIYESSSVLKLEIKNDVDALGIPGFQASSPSGNLSGEIELIKSDLIYSQVIDKLDELNISYISKGRIKDEERFMNSFFKMEYMYLHPDLFDKRIRFTIIDQSRYSINYYLNGNTYSEEGIFNRPFKNEHLDIVITPNVSDILSKDHEEYYIIVNSREALIEMIRANLSVQIVNPAANTLKIVYRDPNPFKAKVIIDYINNVYLANTLELKNQASKQTIDFLDEQLKKTEDKLVESERDLENFVENNHDVNVKDIFSQNLLKIEALRMEIRKEKQKLILLGNLEKAFKIDDTVYYHHLIGSQAELSSYKSIIDDYLQKKRYQQALNYSTNQNTLAYQYANKEIADIETMLDRSFQQDKQTINDNLYRIQKEQSRLEEDLKSIPKKQTEYNRLKRIYDLNEKFYLLLMDKKAEFGISEAGTIPDFQVLSPANLPSEPVFPKKVEVYLIAAGIALVLSFLIIGIRFLVHNTIDSVEEIEKYLTIPMLGVVPYHKLKGKHSKLLVGQNPKSEIAEAIRTIRTNLDFISPNANEQKVISVTSTISSEGKTFISVNLAAIIAMSNQKVILLDLDMRKPKLHLALEKENHFGMSNLLIGKMSIDEVIHNSDQENLDFISSGPPPPNPSELILLPEMDVILEKLKGKYDVIIMDSPPIGLVTDGIILMKKADVPIYIIRSEFSKKAFLKSIKKLQTQKGMGHLSIILNGLKRRGGMTGYGYGYNYGYGADYYIEKKRKKFFGLF